MWPSLRAQSREVMCPAQKCREASLRTSNGYLHLLPVMLSGGLAFTDVNELTLRRPSYKLQVTTVLH